MRLTACLNLPAPGRRQCLYVGLEYALADTCVFAKQSLGPILCGRVQLAPRRSSPTSGSPSPEVTGTFCRVPSPQVTRAPEASRLAYVCPFTVRSQEELPREAFLGGRLHSPWRGPKTPSASALGCSRRICLPGNAYHLASGRPSPDGCFAPASPLGVITRILRYGNIHPFPIAYALRPRLRDRLTRSG